MSVLSDFQDTIYALATPPGVGALGVIRVSGLDAIKVVNEIFPSKDLSQQKGRTIHIGFLVHNGITLDEVVLSLFKNPHSYTGEDIVEISCHGSAYIQASVMDALSQHGARLAKAGEFTQRAFLNGKMDLAQAESVADMIAANSLAAQQAALHQLKGAFSQDLKSLRTELINFAALIELELDFSQEDVEFADRTALVQLIDKLYFSTQSLLDSFRLGNVVKNGVSVAIVGKPNAGKSTLLNALLNEERAIVSDIAGTTRDTIEETLNINGLLFRLIDTAGIRTDTSDAIEAIGVAKSLEKIKEADIVVYLFDAGTESENDIQNLLAGHLKEAKQLLLVANKTDLISGFHLDGWEFISVSAKEKEGIDIFKQSLYDKMVSGALDYENSIVTNARHKNALQKVLESLQDIKQGMDAGLSGDLLVPDIRKCLHYLGEITGEIEVDRDILGAVFGQFCVGK
ncbi:MAG: tRNA uridine-5-carboxymethylaminomethyl(34) synthesis GTPase MnmE [Chitinophagaceae bacterium]